MYFPLSDTIEVQYLTRLFDKMSESYKIFWFQAVVNSVTRGQDRITFEELIHEMIADAWYMVSEYKLNLGPSDTLEGLIHYVYEISGLKSSEKKENIIRFLQTCTDSGLQAKKRVLSQNVPYRLQAPFLKELKGSEWSVPPRQLIEKINQEENLIYYFGAYEGLQTCIEVSPEWRNYIWTNQGILMGWIPYNLIQYLQKRNPNVPGIVNKIAPPQERKLEKVKKYWDKIIHLSPLYEIYAGELVTDKNMSIDHFVPWSYVAHDEFWNLIPTTRSVNSMKSNHLPDWDRYFAQLCRMQYESYELMWSHDRIHIEFEKCRKEHINSDEVLMKLYREGLNREEFAGHLQEIILPVYQSAKTMGFDNWQIR